MTNEIQPRTSVGHETRDAEVRPIVLAGAALAFLLVIFFLVGWVGLAALIDRRPVVAHANPLAVDDPIPPEPRIEEHPALGLQQLRSDEDQILSTYGWVDKNTGVVRIPIDRALELQLERGFPTRKEQPKR